MTWWHDAVVYQIYPRSFADGNGDGVGDLPGITSRLDYLADLGVDAIWLSPFYRSPLNDGGYDVADYCDVDPRFGTLDDFDAMVAAARERDIRVIVDIVPNHCSSAHPLFQAALAASPGSPERELFIFREGRGPNGDEPPNNWQSRFGGIAWTRVPDGQWYLHLFDTSQPDWDWTHPEVPAMFEKILRFWLDRGVAGLRVDVANTLYKEAGLPDVGEWRVIFRRDATSHQPQLHDLYRRWRGILDSYPASVFPGERTAIGENWAMPEDLRPYLSGDGLPQSFNFFLLLALWDAAGMREAIDSAFDLVGDNIGALPWVLGNHDMTRPATRYGWAEAKPLRMPSQDATIDLELGTRRARAAALLLFGLPGSAYLYEGEELGLPQVFDIPADRRDDPVWHRTGGKQEGRDGCRIPIPWSGSAPPFGFSAGANSEPTWLPQPVDWVDFTAEAQLADPSSMLQLYRAALQLRPTGAGALAWVDSPADVLHFRRGDHFACVLNFGTTPLPLPDHTEVLLTSAPLTDGQLPSDVAAWLTH